MDLKSLIDFIKEKQITGYQIAQSTDLTEVGINKILNGSSKNPRKSTIKTLVKFLHNNYGFYLTKEDKLEFVEEPKSKYEISNTNGNGFTELKNGKYVMSVPLIPAKAYATYVSECCEGDKIEGFEDIEFVVDQYARGNYVAFEIKGDSMDNGGISDNPEGCVTLCRELGKQHWTDGFRDAKYGWIIIHNDTVLCKDIISEDLELGTITCHSRNTSPEYSDFTIKLDEVKQIFKIIKRTF